jgi:hypothetical protein
VKQPGSPACRCSMLLCSPLAPRLLRRPNLDRFLSVLVPRAACPDADPGARRTDRHAIVGASGRRARLRPDALSNASSRYSGYAVAPSPATAANGLANAGNSTSDGLTAAAAFDIGSFAFRLDVWFRGQAARRNVSPPTRLPIDPTGRVVPWR